MRLIFLSLLLILFSCHAGKHKTPASVPASTKEVKGPISLKLEFNTTLLIPDKNPEDALSCALVNNTGDMISLGLDTLFRYFTLYGQGASQKYPMYLHYNMPAEYAAGDKTYIDPGKSEVIFRSPLNQLFFTQHRFKPGGHGWQWESLLKQKADYSPVHDYDALQKSATIWFELKWQGKTYSSNKVLLELKSAR